MTVYQYPDYLAHHGVKGMKWGVRRRQKIQKKAVARLTKANKQAVETVENGRKALDYYNSGNNGRSSVNTNSIRKEMSDASQVTRDTMAAFIKLSRVPVTNISTRQYRREVNSILKDTKNYSVKELKALGSESK